MQTDGRFDSQTHFASEIGQDYVGDYIEKQPLNGGQKFGGGFYVCAEIGSLFSLILVCLADQSIPVLMVILMHSKGLAQSFRHPLMAFKARGEGDGSGAASPARSSSPMEISLQNIPFQPLY